MIDVNKIITSLGPRLVEKPWLVTGIAVIILVIFVIIPIALIVKLRNATEVSFLGFKLKTTLPDQALAEEIKKLNLDSEIKSKVIFLARLFAQDFVDLVGSSNGTMIEKLALQILAGLPNILRSNSQHRCSVLIKDEQTENLKILYGFGYSDEALRKMELKITNSCAGAAYRNGEYYCKDTKEDPYWSRLPNATHDYRSIIDIAIKTNEKVLGVLNIDAVEPNAFSQDDIAHLRLFANQFAILLLTRNLIYSKEEEVASS